MTQRIGQYEVLDLLGDGGMGTVYHGRDPRFDRPVAIKVLHSQYARDPEVSERFRAEAVIQAKLNHPNIVTVYDFLAEGEQLAMVMELVEGKTLAELIAANPQGLPEATVVTVMSQVLSAVGFAHGKGLVHRDLKPSNVMVQDLGGGELVAKVMDFGIAKILGAEKMRTATSAKMGTLAYMSPEQLRSPKSVDARSDLYSLGAMLYEMLTGRVPYDADTEYELMRKAIEEEPPSPSRVVPGLGAWWDAVIARAMAKDPGQRFPSAADFRSALVGVSTGSPAAEVRVPVSRDALLQQSAGSGLTDGSAGRAFGFSDHSTAPRPGELEHEWWTECYGKTEGPFPTGPLFALLLRGAPGIRVRERRAKTFEAPWAVPELVVAFHDWYEHRRDALGSLRDWFSFLWLLMLFSGLAVIASEGFLLLSGLLGFVAFAVLLSFALGSLRLSRLRRRFLPELDSQERAKPSDRCRKRERQSAAVVSVLYGGWLLLFALVVSAAGRGDKLALGIFFACLWMAPGFLPLLGPLLRRAKE